MHFSPSRHRRGAGPASAHLRAARSATWRTLAQLLLVLAAGTPLPSAAQDTARTPAPPLVEPPPARMGSPALESALAAEPIPEAGSRDGPGPWVYGLVLGGVALAAAGAGLALHLRRDREPRLEEPLLVFAPPVNPPPELPMHATAAPRAVAAPAPPPRPATPPASAPAPGRIQAPRFAPAPAPASRTELEDELTVRLEVPGEGRLQFLPGALEVVDGTDRQREIRFLRSAGDVTEYTIGRAGGPPTSHVQLPVPTVSRQHARMRFADGAWTIRNLSSTNPLRVNGRELDVAEESPALADGDRIEVGEVVLRFRGPAR